MIHFRNPGEIPRCRHRKHLRHRGIKLSRDLIIFVEKIPAHIFAVTGSGFHGPFMLIRGMVHHEITADAHILFVTGCRQLAQILHISQIRTDGAKVLYGISAVRFSLHGIQKRHQMKHVYSGILEIGKLFLHAAEVFREIIDVQHHAQLVIFLIPVGMRLAVPV